MTDELIETLWRRIPVLMEQAGVPGASVAVVREGRVCWAEGFGRKCVTSAEPVAPDTIFEAASLSKPLFAYLVLQLCDEGKLDLDAPLSQYLLEPYVPDEPRLHLVTARRVLSHTSGFPNWRTRGESLAMQFTPGERFGYSGEGFVYLQRVIERPTGQGLESRVLEPVGMGDSSYVWTESYASRAAIGHDRAGSPKEKDRPEQANAAYSLHTTPTAFATFLLGLVGSRQRGPSWITATSRQAMQVPHVQINRFLHWGLGWGIQRTAESDTLWHWGSNGGFKCFVVGAPRQEAGVVIMTNSDNGLRICKEIVVTALGGDHPAFAWSGVDL